MTEAELIEITELIAEIYEVLADSRIEPVEMSQKPLRKEDCISCEELIEKLQDEDLILKSNMRVVYVDNEGKHHSVGTVSPDYSTEVIKLSE